MLPAPFDGIEVRAVGRQEDRFDVMPDEPFGLVPARVVENQQNALSLFCRNFGGHGVEEDLENFRVAVQDDEADGVARAMTSHWPL